METSRLLLPRRSM